MGSTLNNAWSAFIASFFAFLLPSQIAILSLFILVLLNGLAKLIAAYNDSDIKWYQLTKALNRSKCISYILYAICGYSLGIASITLLDVAVLDGVGITIGDQTVNLLYVVIMISITHVFGSIFKSIEDILQHDIFIHLVDKMPAWMQELIKKNDQATKKEEDN